MSTFCYKNIKNTKTHMWQNTSKNSNIFLCEIVKYYSHSRTKKMYCPVHFGCLLSCHVNSKGIQTNHFQYLTCGKARHDWHLLVRIRSQIKPQPKCQSCKINNWPEMQQVHSMLNGMEVNIHTYIQYQSKVWTHLLIQGFFFIFNIFYIVE